MRALRNLLACFAFMSSSVFASPILQIVDGKFVGVDDIDVNGVSYNVHFQIGSCNELFNGCTESVFGSLNGELENNHSGVISSANAASFALKIFLNTYLDSDDLSLILQPGFSVATPFRALGETFIHPGMDTYISVRYDPYNFGIGDGSVGNDSVVKYAIWEVPEPSGLALLSIALVGLLLKRRKLVR